MNTTEGGVWIVCDGKGCDACALAIGMMQSLLPIAPEIPRSSKDWLFVLSNDQTFHYCPSCAPLYLKALTGSDENE